MIFTTGNLLTLGVVLVAMILFRQLDRNNRTLDKVRKYGDRLKEDLAAFVAQREAAVKDYSVELDVQQKSAKELLKRVVSVEEALAARVEGIAKIDERISAYDKSLEELMRMTSRAQENLVRLRDESAFTDGVVKRVKDAKSELEAVEKGLGELERRFERENAESLERATEEVTAAVRSTVSDLQATAETIERRVEDHRDAVVRVEKERTANLERDIALFGQAYDEALEKARVEADRMEDASFMKLKEQALERSHRFQTAVEEKLAQFQEASKARLAEVQGLVKTFKDDWKQEATELAEKQRVYRDEWKKDVADLNLLAKAGREEWKNDVVEVRQALAAAEGTIAAEGAALLAKAGENAKAAADGIATETRNSLAQLRAELASAAAALRKDSDAASQALRTELESTHDTLHKELGTFSAEFREELGTTTTELHEELRTTSAALDRAEEDFRLRFSALAEETKRLEDAALKAAAEDAERKVAAIRSDLASATTQLRSAFEEVASDINASLATAREEALRIENEVTTRSAAVESAVSTAEEELRKRAAALSEETVRVEATALQAAAEDAERKVSEIRSDLASATTQLRSTVEEAASDIKASLATAREEALRIENEVATRSAAVESAVSAAEDEFRRRSAALSEETTRVETAALQAAVEDAERRQSAIRDAAAELAEETSALLAKTAESTKAAAENVASDSASAVAALREKLEAVSAALRTELENASTSLRAELASVSTDVSTTLASLREESTRIERDAASRSKTVETSIAAAEEDFRRRAAALEEATVRVEAEALDAAAEDASRRQAEIRTAAEKAIATLSQRIDTERDRMEELVKATEERAAALSSRTDAFVVDVGSRLQTAAEEAQRMALEETESRLEAYRAASAARFERLEALADDVGRLDAELRRSMAETEGRVRQDFSLFEKESEDARAAVAADFASSVGVLKTDMDGVERELAALKNRAYDNMSEKLKLFEDDFFADLSKRSDEIDSRLGEWKTSVDASLDKLAAASAEERAAVEASYAEELRSRLTEQAERSLAELERLKTQSAAFEEGVRDQLSQTDQSLQAFKDQLATDLEDARAAAAAATKTEIGRHSIEMSELLKKDQREIEASLKALSDSVDERRADIAERVDVSRKEMEAWQAKIAQQLREADAAVEEARKRSRDLSIESDERIAATRTALQEVRDEADAHRVELFGRADEQFRTLDSAIKDADRRVKEFAGQTKLFERADELKVELERRIEDLGGDMDKLDQRRAEAAELEAQFVKIKRLEDEVNAKMTRFLSEKRRIELMEADFKRLITTAQGVDEKLAQVTASDDTLQGIQAQLKRLDDAASDAEEKYQRIEKKNQILDATADGIDRNFQSLREADATAKRFDEEIKRIADGLGAVRGVVEKLSADKERADIAAEKLETLDSSLAKIEERIEEMQKAREWLARTETRLEEVSKQAQEQVKIMGTLLKAEGGKGGAKDRGAPPIGVRETVVKLAHQGWSVDEIARAVKLSKGEVELILEISPKA